MEIVNIYINKMAFRIGIYVHCNNLPTKTEPNLWSVPYLGPTFPFPILNLLPVPLDQGDVSSRSSPLPYLSGVEEPRFPAYGRVSIKNVCVWVVLDIDREPEVGRRSPATMPISSTQYPNALIRIRVPCNRQVCNRLPAGCNTTTEYDNHR